MTDDGRISPSCCSQLKISVLMFIKINKVQPNIVLWCDYFPNTAPEQEAMYFSFIAV